MIHPLDLFSEVAIGRDEMLPVHGGGTRKEILVVGSEAYEPRQRGMFQEEGSQSGEGLEPLIHHHNVSFEEGLQGDAGSGKGGEEREVEDSKELLVSSPQRVILEEVLQART